MFDRELDRTIDEVAREMTAGEPGSAFRVHVLARVDQYRYRHQWSRYRYQWRPALAGFQWAIAAIVAVLLVVMVFRGVVRLKPEVTNSGGLARLKPDATKSGGLVRLKPDATDGPTGPAKSATPSHKAVRTLGRTP